MKPKSKESEPKIDHLVMDVNGIEMTVSFAHEAVPGVKEQVIAILSDAYEQKCLGNTQAKTEKKA